MDSSERFSFGSTVGSEVTPPKNCMANVSTTGESYGQFSSCNSMSQVQDSGSHDSSRFKNSYFASPSNLTDINKHSFPQGVKDTSSFNNQYVSTNSYVGTREEATSNSLYHQRYSHPNPMAFSSSDSTGAPSPNNISSGEDDYCNYPAMNEFNFYDQSTSFMQQLEQGSFSPKTLNFGDENNPLLYASQTYENSLNHATSYDKCSLNKPPTSCNNTHSPTYGHANKDAPSNDSSIQRGQSMRKQSQCDDVLERFPKLHVQSEVSTADLASTGYLGAFSIKDLADMKVKILNKRLSGVSKNEAQVLKQIRRTLKNREYARICREKRVKERDRIKHDNIRLRNQVEQLKNEYLSILKERDSYRWKYEQLARANGNQSHFSCEKSCPRQSTS